MKRIDNSLRIKKFYVGGKVIAINDGKVPDRSIGIITKISPCSMLTNCPDNWTEKEGCVGFMAVDFISNSSTSSSTSQTALSCWGYHDRFSLALME